MHVPLLLVHTEVGDALSSDFLPVLKKELSFKGVWKLVNVKNPLIIYYWKENSTYIFIFCNYSVYNLEENIDLNNLIEEKMHFDGILIEPIFSRKYKNRNHEKFILNEQNINLRLNPWEFLILKIVFH